MSTALIACRSSASVVAERVSALGWRTVTAPAGSNWQALCTADTDLLVAELPAANWRDRLSAVRRLMSRRPGLRTVFLAKAYPEGYSAEALDGDQSIPLIRLPLLADAFEQSLAAAG